MEYKTNNPKCEVRMAKLAINGATPVRDAQSSPWPKWPKWDEREKNGILEVLDSGIWSYNGSKERKFNKTFAEFIGSKYAVSAANGTVTLQLALEALEIGWGDEVIVPGLTWQATAAAVLDVNAVPVLVDVQAEDWCIDPQAVEAAITPRTKAIIPVHLYGSFAEIDKILEIARKHSLRVIEDCAHKHGGEWNGRKAGSFGDIGSFSFQLSKLMTAGEGGAVTTSDDSLYERLDALRNCGRRPETDAGEEKGTGLYGDDGNFVQSGNYRITDFQAAILLEQLARLPEQNRLRDDNAKYLNGLLSELPGVQPMRRLPQENLEAYFNFAFRYNQAEFRQLPVTQFREALQAELGTAVESCYEPLNKCSLYTPHTKPARHKVSKEYWESINPKRFELKNAEAAYNRESVCFHFSILMDSRSALDGVADAIRKIYDNTDEIRR
jgi:L-glutamine:2-deoxy-scyllo-inosose/3-amino-2,3-dideoxy-scyllo-inosose aminotransferase